MGAGVGAWRGGAAGPPPPGDPTFPQVGVYLQFISITLAQTPSPASRHLERHNRAHKRLQLRQTHATDLSELGKRLQLRKTHTRSKLKRAQQAIAAAKDTRSILKRAQRAIAAAKDTRSRFKRAQLSRIEVWKLGADRNRWGVPAIRKYGLRATMSKLSYKAILDIWDLIHVGPRCDKP